MENENNTLCTDSIALIPDSEIPHVTRSERYKSQESHLSIYIIFSRETNCALGGIRAPNLLEDPLRAQNDAFAFLAIDSFLTNNS